MDEGEDFEGENSSQITDYNSASLMNKRVDEILRDVNKHKRTAEFSKWNADLDAFWCEIGADCERGSKEDIEFNEINKQLSSVSPIVNWGLYSRGFQEINKQQELLKYRQYKLLTEKEMFIRRLMSSQGKLTKKRDESEFYMTT